MNEAGSDQNGEEDQGREGNGGEDQRRDRDERRADEDFHVDPEAEPEEPPPEPEPGGEEDKAPPERRQEPAAEDKPFNYLSPEAIAGFRGTVRFTVGLIGYPGAGKTFFLNRLKHSYANFANDDKRAFNVKPPHDSGSIGPTTEPTYHLFTRRAEDEKAAAEAKRSLQGSDRDFVLFDLPGELFRRAIESGMSGGMAETLNDAMTVCDAVILLLPSELVFGSTAPLEDIIAEQLDEAEAELEELQAKMASPEFAGAATTSPRARQKGRRQAEQERRRAADKMAAREAYLSQLSRELQQRLADPVTLADGEEILAADRRQLEEFVSMIGSMVDNIAAMKRSGMTSAEFDAMSPEEQSALIGQTAYKSFAPLIYVAISKADAVISEESPIIPLREELDEAERDQLDLYPFQAIAVCEPSIYQGITTTFRWYRFDFLTAFEGQSHHLFGSVQPTGVDEHTIRYNSRHFGVTPIIDWLEFAKRKANTLKRTGLARFAATVLRSAPNAELGLARRAELRMAQRRGFHRGESGGWRGALAERLMNVKPERVRSWVIVASLVLGLAALFTTGVAEAAWVTLLRGDAGGYELTDQQPRYPSEVARLRASSPRFATGFLAAGLRPWSQVPDSGSMLAVPTTRRVRPAFVAILGELQQLPTIGSIPESRGRDLIARLNGLQADMNAEYAQDPGSHAGEGLHRERPFINYHVGYVQLQMGDFDGAADNFNRAVELLRGARSANDLEEGRRLGAEIAALYGRGVALMQSRSPRLDLAVAALDDALGKLPASNRRILLTATRTGTFYDFETARTTASLNTANLWADALAAHIRAFRADRDLAPDSALARLIDELTAHKQDIPRDHPLAANYLIAGALLGRPVSQIRMASQAFTDPSQQDVARLAMRAMGDPASFRVRDDIWAADVQIRQAFATGNASALRQTLHNFESSNRVSASDAAFLRTLANDMVSAERRQLPRDERGPLLSAFGEYVRGAGFYSLADDLSRVGGFIVGLLLPALLFLLALRLRRLHLNARETLRMLTEPRHRHNRKAAQAKAAEAPA